MLDINYGRIFCVCAAFLVTSFLIRLADLPFSLVQSTNRSSPSTIFPGAMDLSQDQSEAQAQEDGGFARTQKKSNNETGEDPVIQESFSSDLSSLELRTLHDPNEILDDQDLEKGPVKLTSKYDKYAGEPPDGGLKAWSVILA